MDGTFPTGTTKYEKRAIAQMIPIWDESICIDCGKCAMVCPHASIRMKVFPEAAVAGAPAGFQSKEFKSRELPGHRLTIQVAPDDCTGCGVCVDVCPAKSKTDVGHKSINMEPYLEHRDVERERWDVFLSIPPLDRSLIPHDTVKGAALLEPLFEFSGACGGCGETPYLRLVTQLFGDRMIVANATGCSSIYGANLPTTPWTTNAEGRGPAWANSLFEDNAEFGLGMRLALDAQTGLARELVDKLAPVVGDGARPRAARQPAGDRARDRRPARPGGPAARGARRASTASTPPTRASSLALSADLVRQGVWIIGGDGWAYDIGFGGLDQVLSSGRNVNILVLDTEVYSNTGGQASKATPRGAVAKFAAAGKPTGKKDLGAIARSYGNVFVAQVSMGANDAQTIKALLEADAWPGPSLVIAYSHLHRARHRHVEVDVPPEGRRQERLLAALPLPAERGRGRPAVQAGLRQAVDPDPGVRGDRDAVRHPRSAPTRSGPRSSPSWPRPTPTSAGATTSSWPACTGACPHSPRAGRGRGSLDVPALAAGDNRKGDVA